MQRVDTELLILNTNFGTLSTEHIALEEKVRNEGVGGLDKPRRSDLEIQSQIGIQVDTMVRTQLQQLGLNVGDPYAFKESIQKLALEGNPPHLI